jgi:hypothetical protein
MITDDITPAHFAPLAAPSAPRRPGAPLDRLRCWLALRRADASPEAREAALDGLSGPVHTDPLSKEQ